MNISQPWLICEIIKSIVDIADSAENIFFENCFW